MTRDGYKVLLLFFCEKETEIKNKFNQFGDYTMISIQVCLNLYLTVVYEVIRDIISILKFYYV